MGRTHYRCLQLEIGCFICPTKTQHHHLTVYLMAQYVLEIIIIYYVVIAVRY